MSSPLYHHTPAHTHTHTQDPLFRFYELTSISSHTRTHTHKIPCLGSMSSPLYPHTPAHTHKIPCLGSMSSPLYPHTPAHAHTHKIPCLGSMSSPLYPHTPAHAHTHKIPCLGSMSSPLYPHTHTHTQDPLFRFYELTSISSHTHTHTHTRSVVKVLYSHLYILVALPGAEDPDGDVSGRRPLWVWHQHAGQQGVVEAVATLRVLVRDRGTVGTLLHLQQDRNHSLLDILHKTSTLGNVFRCIWEKNSLHKMHSISISWIKPFYTNEC